METITQFLNQMLNLGQDMNPWHSVVAVLIAYLGGILSSLTPCVYPMIPITVSIVGGIGPTKRPWKEVFIRGFIYVCGMTIVYSFLGIIAGLSGKVFGTLTNNSGWYIAIAAIMTVASLIMLDVFTFEPLALWEKFKRKFLHRKMDPPVTQEIIKKELTWLGILLLGSSSGLIAAPCTTPVLSTILAFIAKSQSIGLGFFLMMAFSFGLGTLLLVIAIFAGAVQLLPKSGQWMKSVKIVSGLILLAFAEYLIYRAGCAGGS